MALSDAILTRLLSLHPKIIDLSLGRMQSILARFGNPECRLPPVIHVAGTNGKGSTVAYLRHIMEADFDVSLNDAEGQVESLFNSEVAEHGSQNIAHACRAGGNGSWVRR